MSTIVTVKQGQLRGEVKDISIGGKFLSFKGIPYAKPPVGKLRFKGPVPPENWQGTRDAIEHGNISPQIDMVTGEYIEGSEDCLYLNVYTPLRNENKTTALPVMLFIHGGGFFSGSGNSDLYGPEYLLSQNVVVVTINYRLEVFGFLSMENEDIPGNAGLKDQVAAMRWVKENIHVFGGDNNNITLYGESAGAASITYHMFSPICEGLFSKVIAHSGVCLHDWAYQDQPRSKAFRLGKLLGCDTEDEKELSKFLREFPAKDLVQVTFRIMNRDEKRRGVPIFFSPVIEKQYGQEAYLTEPIFKLLTQNKVAKVPVLFGYNSKEGINCMNAINKKMKEVNGDRERFVPKELAAIVGQEASNKLGEKIWKFYFGDKDFSKATQQQMIDLQTEFTISYNVRRLALLLSKLSPMPTYLFKFDCNTKLNLMKSLMGYGDLSGATHTDDLFYFFSNQMLGEPLDANTETGKIILQCVRLWTNFAKFGDPTPDRKDDIINDCKWLPITDNTNINYLNIGNKLQSGFNPDHKRMILWDGIYEEAYKIMKYRSKL